MSQLPEDRKPDFSNFPRGAIGIKGLPVNRNARLPSIRSPRDLTLGAQPKRTFLPNIPVRREKRPTDQSKDACQSKSENAVTAEPKTFSHKNDRNKGRGKGKGQIIQTEGAIFAEGIAASPTKGRQREREPTTRSSGSSSGRVFVKNELPDYKVTEMSQHMADLLNPSENDIGDDSDEDMKPVIYPSTEKSKLKAEIKEEFSEEFAEGLGFDIQKISKFIKKEKDDPAETKLKASDKLPKNEFTDLLTKGNQPFLISFPETLTAQMPDYQQKATSAPESTSSTEQKTLGTSLSSLPPGQIGKIQILKSGQVRLVIGSVHYYLDSINSLKSKHEVVSIKTSRDSGDITVLAKTEQKINFVPDIGSVLA